MPRPGATVSLLAPRFARKRPLAAPATAGVAATKEGAATALCAARQRRCTNRTKVSRPGAAQPLAPALHPTLPTARPSGRALAPRGGSRLHLRRPLDSRRTPSVLRLRLGAKMKDPPGLPSR